MNQTVIKYTILRGETSWSLEKAVNEAIMGGWVPLGGVSPDISSEHLFYQAMVKYEQSN